MLQINETTMHVIFGLGNPGKKYARTRHNIGFTVLDTIVKNSVNKISTWETHKKLHGTIWKNSHTLLVKPDTFMNDSGLCVNAVMHMYHLTPKDILVIHDDSDQKIGSMKIVADGSSGGHKGMESIIKNIGTETFKRIKIGIRPASENGKSETFVLKPFSQKEKIQLQKKIELAATAAHEIWNKGLAYVMNMYNGNAKK